jgi:flagellar export protein FliJ
MNNYKFPMAMLLRLREATRDERRVELADAHRVDDVLLRQLQRVDQELKALQQQCRQAAGPGLVDIDRLLEAQRYELAMKAQRLQIIRQRETARTEIERRRQALLDADREVRVLENLRDKQARQHRQEEERQDVKRLDEVGQQQAVRESAL